MEVEAEASPAERAVTRVDVLGQENTGEGQRVVLLGGWNVFLKLDCYSRLKKKKEHIVRLAEDIWE